LGDLQDFVGVVQRLELAHALRVGAGRIHMVGSTARRHQQGIVGIGLAVAAWTVLFSVSSTSARVFSSSSMPRCSCCSAVRISTFFSVTFSLRYGGSATRL